MSQIYWRFWGILLLSVGMLHAGLLSGEDALTILTRQVDQVESHFWFGLRRYKDGIHRERIRREVENLELQARSIQNQINRKFRWNDPPNLVRGAHNLQLIFSRVEQRKKLIYYFQIRFQRTDLKQFNREYQRYQRDLARTQREKAPKNAPRERKRPTKVTLEKVPLDLYAMFLADVTAANIEKFAKTSHTAKKDDLEYMTQLVHLYLGSIAQLRLNIAKLEQRTQYEFKPVEFKTPRPEYYYR